MIRVIIENVLLLLLPTILYLSYVFLTSNGKAGKKSVVDDAPFLWLFLAGIGLALAVVVIFGKLEGSPPGHSYRPPEFRDGKIVPGKVQEKPKPSDG